MLRPGRTGRSINIFDDATIAYSKQRQEYNYIYVKGKGKDEGKLAKSTLKIGGANTKLGLDKKGNVSMTKIKDGVEVVKSGYVPGMYYFPNQMLAGTTTNILAYMNSMRDDHEGNRMYVQALADSFAWYTQESVALGGRLRPQFEQEIANAKGAEKMSDEEATKLFDLLIRTTRGGNKFDRYKMKILNSTDVESESKSKGKRTGQRKKGKGKTKAKAVMTVSPLVGAGIVIAPTPAPVPTLVNAPAPSGAVIVPTSLTGIPTGSRASSVVRPGSPVPVLGLPNTSGSSRPVSPGLGLPNTSGSSRPVSPGLGVRSTSGSSTVFPTNAEVENSSVARATSALTGLPSPSDINVASRAGSPTGFNLGSPRS